MQIVSYKSVRVRPPYLSVVNPDVILPWLKTLATIGLILFASNKAIENLSPSYVGSSTNSVVTR